MGEVVETDFVCFNPVVVGDFVVLIVDSAIVVVDSMTVVIDCVVVLADFVLDIVDSLVDTMARHPRSKNEQINLIMQEFVQKICTRLL